MIFDRESFEYPFSAHFWLLYLFLNTVWNYHLVLLVRTIYMAHYAIYICIEITCGNNLFVRFKYLVPVCVKWTNYFSIDFNEDILEEPYRQYLCWLCLRINLFGHLNSYLLYLLPDCHYAFICLTTFFYYKEDFFEAYFLALRQNIGRYPLC